MAKNLLGGNTNSAEDVLMHKNITGLEFKVQLVQMHSVSASSHGDYVHSNSTKRVHTRNSSYLGNISPPSAFGLSPSFELGFEAKRSYNQMGVGVDAWRNIVEC